MFARAEVPIVHAVTTDAILASSDFEPRARAVMIALGPRGALHLRARSLPAVQLYALAAELRPLQNATGCWLVVNDRLDIALAAGATGAQLASHSLTVADARAIAPGLALGASVHDAEQAADAAREGATWVVAGHVFDTPSHAGRPARGPDFITRVSAAAGAVPCIAIGGIRAEHVDALCAAGAHGVAVVRGIWHAADAARAATEYLSAHDGDLRR